MASKSVVRLLQNSSKLNSRSLSPPIVASTRSYASKQPDNEITHTGQQFEADDYRLVRFTNRPKEVNPNWAIKLIEQVPPKPEKARIVACDGGGGPLGHPKVYINLDKPGNHSCGYCGLRFYKEDHHH